MKRKYSIGLDIGVSSVGWACITESFQIPEYNGRYAIGVREFESAETAEERRIQRGTRRRYNRRIKRIQLLQQLTAPLLKGHSNFFIKSNETEKHFWRNNNKFENKSLSEILIELGENPKKYPTIYHLRKQLINEDKAFDPRLIYLALHNLVKFRGHFLNEHMEWTDSTENENTIDFLRDYMEVLTEIGYTELDNLNEDILKEIEQTLESKEYSSSDKRNSIKKLIGKEVSEPISLVLGLKSTISKLFPNSENAALYKEEKLKMSFNDEDFTEVYEKLTDEEKIVIDLANHLYQHVLLNDLLAGHNCVSEAKVDSYNQFREDLNFLKHIYNKFLGEKRYRDMFITSRSNQTKYKNTKNKSVLCSFDRFLKDYAYEDTFYKELKKVFESLLNDAKTTDDYIESITTELDRLKNNEFLQKQRNHLNAAIPHQNNVHEASVILKNQQKFYPEITEDVIEKVSQVISFRIPYYIGPLTKSQTENDFGWVVRKKENEHVLPWTIDDIIDRSESAEKFIQQMTSYCAYLTNEKVLPKHSLQYEMFEVLNELNGIQIRAEYELPHKKFRLSYDEKAWIIDNIFKKYKNVTLTLFKRELKNSPFKDVILNPETDGLRQIFGTQKEDKFGTSLSSHITMSNIFPTMNEYDYPMMEELIYWNTTFEDKDIIKLKINEKYDHLTNSEINKLIRLPFAGWGRLSKKIINELPADTSSNQTILDIMKEDSVGFMEILGIEKYQLSTRISKLNYEQDNSFKKIKYKDIADLQGSPAVKKGIWQSILVIEDLVDIFGEPEHIMIEFAREDSTKRRTTNRKKQISDIEKSISKDEIELKNFLKEHSHYTDTAYKDSRLYLYITQEGKCLYTGEMLNVERLQDYEVDHILPKNFVKDDSMDNLALVTSTANQLKKGTKMPLEIINEKSKYYRKLYWKKLFDNNLISQSKYFKLMKDSFSDQDKESFFARQLVETRQITKHVKDLLHTRYEHAKVHPVNANIVTNLRKHSNISKIRDLNNKHHAIDAALAALIIQFIINKYGHNFLQFNFKYSEAHKKWREMLNKYQKHFFLFSDIDHHNKFSHFETGEILSGREFMNALNAEMPWQTTKKIGGSEEAFYKETIYSPKARTAKYTSNKTTKGVHIEMKTDSTYLISYKEVNKKGKEKLKSEFVDLYVIEKYQMKDKTKDELAVFLAEKVAKEEVLNATIHTKIDKHQRVYHNDHEFYYVSSSEMHNAKQLILDTETLNQLVHLKKQTKTDYNVDELQETFARIGLIVSEQYESFLPVKNIQYIQEYHHNITDLKSFNHAITNLFSTTSASAARSTLFGYRYNKKSSPADLKFIHESITGLHHKKPKSFQRELWSN